jgi:D-alanyl-D-alanine endopeptidase (penicillin-binding protein 7)
MQAQMAGRKLIFVLLDSAGKYSRLGDAERIRRWLASGNGVPAAAAPGAATTAATAGAAAAAVAAEAAAVPATLPALH